MKTSVLIPAYNCAATILATLNSVLRQTSAPDEILVMNDGSTDDTASILESYKERVTVYSQLNRGIASARNELVARATGDLIAFLDSDDLWHPRYLEVQQKLFHEHPEAVAFFTGHVNFHGNGDYEWKSTPSDTGGNVELIPALDFFKRYNKATGPFSCFSYCCLVAYRLRENSLSHNHGRTFGSWVHVFELLEEHYKEAADTDLWRAFQFAFASKRRFYAKLLMGTGRPSEARKQLVQSLNNSGNPVSIAKSLSMLILTYLPRALQPSWPGAHRVIESPENT